jgi:FdhD protein
MGSLSILKLRTIKSYDQGSWKSFDDQLVTEEHLQIILNGQKLVSLACSPEHTRELAVGYLFSEGFISHYEDLSAVKVIHPLQVEVETTKAIEFSTPQLINTCMGRGSGIPIQMRPHPDDHIPWSPGHLLQMIEELDANSETFKKTGGVHGAAIGDRRGTLMRYDDIGRHNALDKVIGHAFLQQIPLHNKCLLLSGRIASEILFKLARTGFPMIVSRSAPTYKAVEEAERLGITVVGFARGQRFNLYCHGERIAKE